MGNVCEIFPTRGRTLSLVVAAGLGALKKLLNEIRVEKYKLRYFMCQ